MKTNETDIPTQQTPPQKNHRLSSSYENCGRPQSDQPQAKSRPQKIGRLTFSKNVRLRSRREFQRVAKEGKRLVGRFFCIDYRPARLLKLGISASTKYGSAPERNRFKRLIREAFRQAYSSLPSYELNIVPRQCAKKALAQEIREELTRLLK
jgi:ribonuclease P protein component